MCRSGCHSPRGDVHRAVAEARIGVSEGGTGGLGCQGEHGVEACLLERAGSSVHAIRAAESGGQLVRSVRALPSTDLGVAIGAYLPE